MNKEEENALKDCDTVFICLEDMMSEESANKYRLSYRRIKKLIEKQQKEIDRLKKDKDILYGVIDELKGVNNE